MSGGKSSPAVPQVEADADDDMADLVAAERAFAQDAAELLPRQTMSFGHLSRASMPAADRTASATATPAMAGISAMSFRPGLRMTDA